MNMLRTYKPEYGCEDKSVECNVCYGFSKLGVQQLLLCQTQELQGLVPLAPGPSYHYSDLTPGDVQLPFQLIFASIINFLPKLLLLQPFLIHQPSAPLATSPLTGHTQLNFQLLGKYWVLGNGYQVLGFGY